MHPSLYKLMTLTFKANLRRLFRGARSARGAFLIIFTIGIFSMMFVPSVVVAFMPNGPAGLFSGLAEPVSLDRSVPNQLAVHVHIGGRQGPLFQSGGS